METNDLRKAAEMALEAFEMLDRRGGLGLDVHEYIRTKIEALRQALAEEALDEMVAENQRLGFYDDGPAVKTYAGGKPNYCTPVDAVNMTQERVDETVKSEHEPVAWANAFDLQNFDMRVRTNCDLMHTVPLYTAPPKRYSSSWVGLTDEDKQEAFNETQEASGGFWEFADYLEAKLKEKNG